MDRQWWGRFSILSFFVVLSVLYIIPTFSGMDLEKTKFPIKQKINLGLDLQGGLYLVLGVDFNQVYKDVLDRQSSSLSERLKEKKMDVKSAKVVKEGFPSDDPRIVLEYDAAQKDAVYKTLKDEYWSLRITQEAPGRYELGIALDQRAEIREKTINQSIEVIRNRIDEFGVSEPVIASQGNDRIVVELPGVKEVDRAKELIGRTAKLEFKLVDDKGLEPGKLIEVISQIEKDQKISFRDGTLKFPEYVKRLNEAAKGKIPEGDLIAFEKSDRNGVASDDKDPTKSNWIPFLLKQKAEVTGDDLQDASVQFDPETRRPNVGFTFNPRGAALFEKFTGDNIGSRLAIVLDNTVHSAPVIQSRIGARGQITLGQGDNDKQMREAKDLAIVLRAGALPAQLEFQEQRVIGPSLGQDSIKKGALASLVGILAVFFFTAFYYKKSGLIAVVSLLINVLFVLATLVGIEATLTLPGIAGIALTVGIAVDSNVVVYERIREELRHGKSVFASVDAGFQKALRTIMDANVTNAAAAIILMNYGTGPVKGFAVTLLIGIITTLFTAVFACRVMFDLWLKNLEKEAKPTLSI